MSDFKLMFLHILAILLDHIGRGLLAERMPEHLRHLTFREQQLFRHATSNLQHHADQSATVVLNPRAHGLWRHGTAALFRVLTTRCRWW
jgi:hypothetical protein